MLKIGTYNLTFLFTPGTHKHSGTDYEFTEDFIQSRYEYFAKEFEKLDRDILFLQEVGGEDALRSVLEKIETEYEYFIAEPDRQGVGNAVIYKKGLDCTCKSAPTNTDMPVFNQEHSDGLGDQLWSRRDYVLLTTTHKDKPLHILGVHVKSNFLMWGPQRALLDNPSQLSQTDAADAVIRSEIFRLNQARKIREIADETLKKGASLIILGDFNAKTDNKLYSIVQGKMKKLDTALSPALDSIPEEKRYTLIGHISKGLIDHVFVSKDLESKVEDIKIHNEDLYDHSTNPDAPYIIESDHAAVTFNLI